MVNSFLDLARVLIELAQEKMVIGISFWLRGKEFLLGRG